MSFTISNTESSLVEACLQNDRLAQKALYDRYKDAMYTVAYRITNDFDLAQDVLQDAFIQIFKGLKNFRKESTVFVLIEIEGYPHKEVAKMLNISEGTSKSQLFHAKKKLREYLNNME